MARNRIREFWQWFAENEEAFCEMVCKARKQSDPEQIMEMLGPLIAAASEQLQRIHPDLGAVIGGGDPPELVITAHGSREAFPAVRRVAMSAPVLRCFRVVAFRPRIEFALLEEAVQTGGPDIAGVRDFYFDYRPKGRDEIDLTVYSPLLRPGADPDDSTLRVFFNLLDMVLGEYDAAVRVGANLEFRPMPEPLTPEHSRIQPLIRLREVVDQLFPK